MDPGATILPQLDNIDETANYVLSGMLLIAIRDAIRMCRIKIDADDSPLKIREAGPQGLIIGIDTTPCP